jgi:DNA/RNA endonuclease YhcR with UshA esterase domain
VRNRTVCSILTTLVFTIATLLRAQESKEEPTPPSTQAAPILITADDAAGIKAALDKDVILDGRVKSAAWAASGKVMRIQFEGAQDTKIQAVLFQAKKEKFDGAFDGDVAKAIAGAHVRVSGKLKDYKGTPEVVVNDVHQLTIIEPGPSTQPARE